MEENPKRFGKKIFFIAVATVAVIVAVAAIIWFGGNDKRKIARNLDLGYRYLAEGNWKEAKAQFDKAIEIDSKNIDAYAGAITAAQQLDEDWYDTAMTVIAIIESTDESNEDYAESIAAIYLKAGDYNYSIGDYETAVKYYNASKKWGNDEAYIEKKIAMCTNNLLPNVSEDLTEGVVEEPEEEAGYPINLEEFRIFGLSVYDVYGMSHEEFKEYALNKSNLGPLELDQELYEYQGDYSYVNQISPSEEAIFFWGEEKIIFSPESSMLVVRNYDTDGECGVYKDYGEAARLFFGESDYLLSGYVKIPELFFDLTLSCEEMIKWLDDNEMEYRSSYDKADWEDEYHTSIIIDIPEDMNPTGRTSWFCFDYHENGKLSVFTVQLGFY